MLLVVSHLLIKAADLFAINVSWDKTFVVH